MLSIHIHRLVTLVCILASFAIAQNVGWSQQAQPTPFEFAQRSDVGREINIEPNQLAAIDRLQPICDAQCLAQVMEDMSSIGTDLQNQFLSSTPEQRVSTIQALEREIRESIEMSMLADGVLDEVQMTRLAQLRLQFMGLDGLMSERVRSLMGFSEAQENQLTALQDIGLDAAAICQQLAATDPGINIQQLQQGIGNVQNILIDQSINILNGAQIQIFQGLLGEECTFDSDGEGDPTGDEDGQGDSEVVQNTNGEQGSGTRDSVNEAPSNTAGSGTRVGSVNVRSGGSTPTNESTPQPAAQDGSDRR